MHGWIHINMSNARIASLLNTYEIDKTMELGQVYMVDQNYEDDEFGIYRILTREAERRGMRSKPVTDLQAGDKFPLEAQDGGIFVTEVLKVKDYGHEKAFKITKFLEHNRKATQTFTRWPYTKTVIWLA